jgi:alanine dehydrogenase
MRIGLPKEIKNHEYRVGLTPAAVAELTARGHAVTVQTGAGAAIDFTDTQYAAAGAELAVEPAAIWAGADLVVKVKEPQPAETAQLRPGQVLFTYLHLAADRPQTEALIGSGAVAIAYETVTDARGGLPLLAPMSEVAGRLSIQAGATYLQLAHGGRGVLLGGVPGVAPGRVVVLGGGVAGSHAARMAAGLGADVALFDRSVPRLRELDREFGGRIKTLYSTREAVGEALRQADLVIGAALVPGAAAPKLVTRDMLKTMPRGAVLVDISIDQGGCFETSRPTTHADPVYVVDGIVHYCVTNMPGAVARTSTQALTQATLPFVLALAERGWQAALAEDAHLRNGLNVCRGQLTHPGVAQSLALPCRPPEAVLA